jgi:hypothetical protein
VASQLTPEELQRLARLGAAARIEELEKELAALRAAFPGIGAPARRKPGRKPGRPRAQESVPAAPAPSPAPARRPGPTDMSAAARKAVSKRMKHYWAEWRKKKAKAAKEAK